VKQAVILAGGKGTRLKDRLDGRPKPLVDLGGRPLLERQMMLLKRYGFDQVLVLVNHRADQIIDFCESRGGWSMDVRCIDDGEPLGTAGAILAILDQLADESLIVYGDTMLEVDIDRFHAFHRRDPASAATLFLHPNDHPYDSDLVELADDNRVLAFHPYPHPAGHDLPNLVNAALYWVRRDSMQAWRGNPGQLDFGKDLFPSMLSSGSILRGYVSPEYIKDCGTPERLDRVAADFASGKIARASLANPQRVVFLDRDGTLNQEVDHLNNPDQLSLLRGVPEAVRALNQSEFRSCVITNQPVVARGECTMEGLRAIHNRLETLLGGHGAYLDRIYVCPHHPHRGFAGERPELKIECSCRKPATGMIDQAEKDFNIDLCGSWVVGDTTADIETARRAGLASVLVETGYAGLDGRYDVRPDFIAADLPGAVELILHRYSRLRSLCEELVAEVEPGAIVQVTGLPRTGMTTLATGVRHVLEARGFNVQSIDLDNWQCAPVAQAGVMPANLDMDSLPVRALKRLETGVDCDPDAVTVIEGTALLFPEMAGLPVNQKLILRSDEDRRRRRVLRKLELRGFGAEQAERIRSAADEALVPLAALCSRQVCNVDIDGVLS
jgi:histidinol-phosphate phosphatase family protein